ncbi:P-loop containing nucleoside triphosphate hydrolase protein [Hypoxylon sp. NC0597]|nr:P-loop containing nucleoside triphosphate hydrolase protein [Hypoxylon sp. NC0597]
MADPLSIAAAVAGLVQLSAKIYTTLSEFVSRIQKAPQAAYDLLLSLSEMRLALASVSELIDSFLKIPLERRAMVQIDHLIMCLTQSVLTFSSLEKFVGTWPEQIVTSRWQKWRFANQEEKLMDFNTKVQQQKISISLALNILQSESDIEARKSLEALQGNLQNMLEDNRDLQNQLRLLGGTMGSSLRSMNSRAVESSRSMLTTIDEEGDNESQVSTMRHSPMKINLNTEFGHTASPPSATSIHDKGGLRARENLIDSTMDVRPFEHDLVQSLVYARVLSDECDVSFTTSQPKSAFWSLLSGRSLDQISNMSVIALPISIKDIWNSSWYRTNLLSPAPDTETYKVAVLGYKEAGKSALVRRFRLDLFDDDIPSSVSDTSYSVALNTEFDNTPIRMHITDTAWANFGIASNSRVINEADGFVITYSAMDFTSFFFVHYVYDKIIKMKGPSWPRHKKISIVGTKSDLADARLVSKALGHSVADELGCSHFECSARTGENVEDAFLEVARGMRKRPNSS